MVNTPAQAVAKSLAITTGYGGYCLRFVRVCYGLPGVYPSAIAQWNAPGEKHQTSDLSLVPVGAPLFLTSPKSKYGHVAIYLGNGNIRTTNSSTNRIHTQSVAAWTRAGYTVVGWRNDLCNTHLGLPVPTKPKPPASGNDSYPLKKGSKGPRVGRLQQGLRNVFPAYAKSVSVKRGVLIAVDDIYGDQTDAWVREFQERVGITVDGVVGEKETVPALKRYGITLD